jgi:hypothetical protein
MLPGFRFLFAAIVLSISVLVFGLGAAAVLRAAHEQFADSGTWRPAPDTSAAQQGEMSRPVLAVLRIDQPAPAPSPDAAPATPPAQPAELAPSPAPDKTAALEAPAASPAETAKDQTAKAETAKAVTTKAETKPDTTDTKPDAAPELAKTEVAAEPPKVADRSAQLAALPAAPAHQDTPAVQTAAAVDALAAAEPKTAAADPAPAATPAIAPSPPADEPAAVSTSEAFPPDHPSAPAAADPVAAKIATLGGPPVVIEQPAAEKAARVGPDPSEVTKEREKERAEERARRRRLAARRARLAAQAAQTQQAADPFTQPNPMIQYAQPIQANASARTR